MEKIVGICLTLVLLLSMYLMLASADEKVSGCMDTIEFGGCEFIKTNGWCEEDIAELQKKCDKSCGWCSESDECVDSADYIDCKSLSPQECGRNSSFYLTRCKKSCNWCKESPQAIWEPWDKWSRCSTSCGYGYRTRRRRCRTKKCIGASIEVNLCTKHACPTWTTWGPWQSCTATCDRGQRSRTRECSDRKTEKNGCRGSRTEESFCNTQNCTEPAFNVWTKCSKSCGEGTRMKVISCTSDDRDKCPKVFEDCNTFPCDNKNCTTFRYGSSSECCVTKPSECGIHRVSLGFFGFFPFGKRRRREVDERVLGGEISNSFPWMARLEILQGTYWSRFKCGATLIHPQYVITAAHCLVDYTAVDLIIIVGSTSRQDNSHFVQRIRASNFTVHPEYTRPKNDVAVIKLKTRVTLSQRVGILCLPNGEETPVDATCYVAGWGLTNPFSTSASVALMEGKVRHLPFGVCENGYAKTSYGSSTDEKIMMCAGKISGEVDTCGGDSGGPLMCQRCSSCSWYLAGVTSFGAYRCGTSNRPGVYTRVLHYEKWITSLVDPSERSKYSCTI